MVYAPAGASLAKLALIDGLGAEIRIAGTDLDFAKDEGKRFAAEAQVPFFEDEPSRRSTRGTASSPTRFSIRHPNLPPRSSFRSATAP